MPIISVRDIGNNKWKRKAKNNNNNKIKNKTNKDRKEQRGTEAMVKGSKLNDFVVHLS